MKINRRSFLSSVAVAASATTLSGVWRHGWADDGVLELLAGPTKHRLYKADAPESDLWTYNGQTPGPEVRVGKGDRVRVRLINRLEEPTSVHWHGIRIANAMDGVAGLTQDAVPPGETFEYDFVVPDAGTFWYHAHNRSWNQVARGLYGPLIVDEPESPFDREHDLTLVLDDWRLGPDGTLDTASLGSLAEWAHAGRLGNWLTVNGESLPTFKLKAGDTYRLRLINAANARMLELDPSRFGALILGFDGQALPEPSPLSYSPLVLGPAQRVDLQVVARASFAVEEISGQTPFSFMAFEVEGEADATPAGETVSLAPNLLPEPDLSDPVNVRLDMAGGAMGGAFDIVYNGKKLEDDEVVKARQMWAFNGVANIASEPLFRTPAGRTVVIETVNRTVFAHAMHVHGHHFRVIERSGATVDEGRPWRDTFLVGPEQTTRIAFVADNPGKWLIHCHMLEHAAGGMTTWFEVA